MSDRKHILSLIFCQPLLQRGDVLLMGFAMAEGDLMLFEYAVAKPFHVDA